MLIETDRLTLVPRREYRLPCLHGQTDAQNVALAAGPPAVNLGQAGNYAVLAQSLISTTPTSFVGGNLGISPATSAEITGFAIVYNEGEPSGTSPFVSGGVFASNYGTPTPGNLVTAVNDRLTAYNDAQGRTTTAENTNRGASGDIGGLTFTPGVYKYTTAVTTSRDVVLSGACGDIFIFQIS
jgi:hypothetical protein